MAVDHFERRAALGMPVGVGQLRLDDQAVAVLHQGVPHEAEDRAGPAALAEQARVGIGRRGVGGVRPPLAPEVDFGVAVVAGGLGHRGGLLGGLVGGLWCSLVGASVRRGGRLARTAVIGRRILRPRLEALHRGPGLDQGAVDGEVFVRQKRRYLPVGENGSQELARHLRRQQPVAVLGENRRDPCRIIDAETHEPAQEQIVLHLLHQLPLGAHREQELDQAGPHQPLGRDRWPTFRRVEPVELGVQAGQRLVHDPLHLPQRVPRRDASSMST